MSSRLDYTKYHRWFERSNIKNYTIRYKHHGNHKSKKKTNKQTKKTPNGNWYTKTIEKGIEVYHYQNHQTTREEILKKKKRKNFRNNGISSNKMAIGHTCHYFIYWCIKCSILRHRVADQIKKKKSRPTYMLLTGYIHRQKIRGWKQILYANRSSRKLG